MALLAPPGCAGPTHLPARSHWEAQVVAQRGCTHSKPGRERMWLRGRAGWHMPAPTTACLAPAPPAASPPPRLLHVAALHRPPDLRPVCDLLQVHARGRAALPLKHPRCINVALRARWQYGAGGCRGSCVGRHKRTWMGRRTAGAAAQQHPTPHDCSACGPHCACDALLHASAYPPPNDERVHRRRRPPTAAPL